MYKTYCIIETKKFGWKKRESVLAQIQMLRRPMNTLNPWWQRFILFYFYFIDLSQTSLHSNYTFQIDARILLFMWKARKDLALTPSLWSIKKINKQRRNSNELRRNDYDLKHYEYARDH